MGKGIFMEALEKALIEKNIHIKMIGIKTSEADKSVGLVKEMLDR